MRRELLNMPDSGQEAGWSARSLHESARRQPLESTGEKYTFRMLQGGDFEPWDRFVAAMPGGHHVQTHPWASIKARQGWRALHLVVKNRAGIAGGAQILVKRLPVIGSIGYLDRGPLVSPHAPTVAGPLIEQLKQLARRCAIRSLVVQPPAIGFAWEQILQDSGFRLNGVRTSSRATVVLELSPDIDVLLSRMKPKTRYNVLLSQRKGICVREGVPADLPAFYRLLEQTGQRQKFSPNRASYLTEMCRILGQAGQFKLFLAEFEDQAVSGMLAIPFGDTVIYKRGAWSGLHGNRRPNEALHWFAIQWAKARGFRYYDFDGIEARTAGRVAAGKPLPDSMLHSVTRFKLGFGGQVVLLPGSYYYIYHPLLRWSYQQTVPLIARSRTLSKTVKWARNR